MTKRMKLIIRVNEQAGSEEFYKKSQHLGLLAVQCFREEQERHRSQMTGLENIAETTLKVTDVLDYIKKQTAHQREKQGQREQQGWKKKVGANGELFGQVLKEDIETGLDSFINKVCENFINSTTDEGKQERQEVHLLLIRQLIRQLVVRYEYEMSLIEEKAKR
ncbi:MAG: hypothetical protein JO202_03025 [Ktedonobacteraceae bacterium]|nr:hypothetical protein [Ktedonobacteraceae bacterium]